jgi:hypothetical protein
MKKSFILHIDSLAILEEMTLEQKGILFDAIYNFQKGNEVTLDFAMKMAFAPFKNQFIRDDEKYNEFKDKQAENGKKGGRPPKKKDSEETQKSIINPNNPSLMLETQKSPNVSMNDSVSLNDSKTSSLPPEEKKVEGFDLAGQELQELKDQVKTDSLNPKLNKKQTLDILRTDLDLINQVLREFKKSNINTDSFCLTNNDIYQANDKFKTWYEGMIEDCILKAHNDGKFPRKLGDTKMHVINFLRYQDFAKLKTQLTPRTTISQPAYEREYD